MLHWSGGMAFREFVDTLGTEWHVWEVVPQSVERRRQPERRTVVRSAKDRRTRRQARVGMSEADARGWLVFESRTLKKRLRPTPLDWDRASVTELESMCARAERASRRTQRLIE